MGKREILLDMGSAWLFDWRDPKPWTLEYPGMAGERWILNHSNITWAHPDGAIYYEFVDNGIAPAGNHSLWSEHVMSTSSQYAWFNIMARNGATRSDWYATTRRGSTTTHPLTTAGVERQTPGDGLRHSILIAEAGYTFTSYIDGELVYNGTGGWDAGGSNYKTWQLRLHTRYYTPKYFAYIPTPPTPEQVAMLHEGDGESVGAWTGTEEVPVSVDGMWDGNTTIPVTPEIT